MSRFVIGVEILSDPYTYDEKVETSKSCEHYSPTSTAKYCPECGVKCGLIKKKSATKIYKKNWSENSYYGYPIIKSRYVSSDFLVAVEFDSYNSDSQEFDISTVLDFIEKLKQTDVQFSNLTMTCHGYTSDGGVDPQD